MKLAFWLLLLCSALATPAAAQDLAFGSDTWRGQMIQPANAPPSCRVSADFGNGDRISFAATVPAGSVTVSFLVFVTPGGVPENANASIAPVLTRAASGPPPRLWVDDDSTAAVTATVANRLLMAAPGTLDTPAAAKFFNAIREGAVLHVAIDGQDRRYLLRGSFAALSELVGCALKARDGEAAPSAGPPTAAPPLAASQTTPPAATAPTATPPPMPAPPRPRQLVSSGSGIVVTTEGHVLTNHHVTDGCRSFGLRAVGGGERTATLIAADEQNDLALLQAATPYPEAAVLRIEPPRLAEPIIVYGFPLSGILASSGNVTLGNISAMTGLRDDSRDVQITAAVQPGNSGGPVFDGSGLLLAVVQSKLNAIRAASVTGDIAQNVNFAIRGSLAASFLGANGVEPAFERRRPAMPPDDVAGHAQRVTVQVLCYGDGR
jgi:S1-C subfamily serine protease